MSLPFSAEMLCPKEQNSSGPSQKKRNGDLCLGANEVEGGGAITLCFGLSMTNTSSMAVNSFVFLHSFERWRWGEGRDPLKLGKNKEMFVVVDLYSTQRNSSLSKYIGCDSQPKQRPFIIASRVFCPFLLLEPSMD